MAKRSTLYRYAGAKGKLSEQIVPCFPANSAGLHYHEPFVGSGTVGIRTIQEHPFRSYSLSDLSPFVVRALQAIRGDLTDWGDIIERAIETAERFLPESENEPAIREYYDACREPAREGDYWSYLVLCQYARKQFAYPQRADFASFDARYFGQGLSRLNPTYIGFWRSILSQATIKQADAFEILAGLGHNDFAFIDSPYLNCGSRMYAVEFENGLNDHERLRDLLLSAKFSWAMSTGNSKLYREWFAGYDLHKIYYKQKGQRNKYSREYELLITHYVA